MNSNFKNMVVTGILTSVFMMGAQAANAGLLISDRSVAATDTQACTTQNTTDASFTDTVVGAVAATATRAITGLLISDRAGFLLSDRSGFLLSDRSGLLITDRSACK